MNSPGKTRSTFFMRVATMQLTRLAAGFVLLMLCGASRSFAQFGPLPPVPAREFAIMAWGNSPSDPGQLQEMKQAGLNVSGFCRAADANRVRAVGLSCFVTGDRANGYDWEKLPPANKLRANLTSLAAQVGDDPAVLGVFLRDEPGASLMPGLGEVAAAVRQALPGRWPYVNLFPVSVRKRLGVADYAAYVRKEIELIHPPFISYDNYSLVDNNGKMRDLFYQNLEVIRRMSLEAKIPFWNCISAVAHANFMNPTDANLRLQVYSTLAYGGRGIQYYTYFTPPFGNYRLGPIDPFGNRTATWYKLRRINFQIRALAPTLVRLRSTGVYQSAPLPAGARPVAQSHLIKEVVANADRFPPFQATYLVGEFVDPNGHPFVMLVNKDFKHSMRYLIRLRQPYSHLFQISPYTGKAEPFHEEMNWLAPGAGALFQIR